MTTTVELKTPVNVGGEEITSLTMRAPKVRDMVISDKSKGSDGEKEVTLFANLCDVDEDVILELALADFSGLQETYHGFLS